MISSFRFTSSAHSKRDVVLLLILFVGALLSQRTDTIVLTIAVMGIAPLIDLICVYNFPSIRRLAGLLWLSFCCILFTLLFDYFQIVPLMTLITLIIRGLWNSIEDGISKTEFVSIVILTFVTPIVMLNSELIPFTITIEPATNSEAWGLGLLILFPVVQQFTTGAHSIQERRRYLEAEKVTLTNRYNQIIEMYQVLNHNLKTPLANALGKVEIALLTKDTSRLHETKESMLSALGKLNTITLVKKIVAQTSRLDEFLKEWQIAFNHQDIAFGANFEKAQSVHIIEESGIALAIALDIFANNSKEAGADEIEIDLENKDSRIMVCIRDNGSGLDEKRLELFGQIQQSSKGSSGLGTYLAVRLLKAANIELDYFNRPSGGFEIQMEL